MDVSEDAAYYVGVDWAAEVHAVCVLDDRGKVVAGFPVAHSADGITTLIHRLARLGSAEEIAVGIERPNGRLVDLLLEAGHPVVPVSPNAIKTWRDGEVLSGAKSDAGDAAVIAEYLRLRAHRLRVLPGYSAETKALRTVVRTRDDLVDMRVAATNQLAALLDAHWPGAKAIFADIESPIALAFLTRYPTAAAARHLGEKRLTGFLVKHGYSGRRPAGELLTRLRQAPTGTGDETLTEAVHDAVLALVAVLTAIGGALKNLDRSVAAHLGEHRTGRSSRRCKVGSDQRRPGARRVGRRPRSLRLPDAVAALAGVTPVTKESGKHRAVHFRWACNKRFRRAITIYADNSRHASPWAAHIYNQARAAGKDHTHAVRILARAWTRIIWRCWQDGVAYDPTRHGGANKINNTSSAA